MQQELVSLYQFLHHVTSVVIIQVKSCTDSIFCCFCELEINLNEKQQTSLMSANDKKFCQLSADSVDL